jgi:hypothetical protein
MFSRLKEMLLPAWLRWCVYGLICGAMLVLGEMDGQQRAGQAHLKYVVAQAERTAAIGQAQTKVVVQTEIRYRDRIKTVYLKEQ